MPDEPINHSKNKPDTINTDFLIKKDKTGLYNYTNKGIYQGVLQELSSIWIQLGGILPPPLDFWKTTLILLSCDKSILKKKKNKGPS